MYLLVATFTCFLALITPFTSAILPPEDIPETGPLGPKCPEITNCTNPCAFVVDANGCKRCICPRDCRSFKCPAGQVCKNLCASIKSCEDYQCVPFCKPVNCTNKCLSGYWYDSNGCQTCRCNNVCENVACKVNETCVPRNITNPQSGYDCIPNTKLCCPKPVIPKDCFIQNYCKKCQLDCKTVFCSKNLKCCPDWFGCNQCVKPVLC